MCNVCGCSEGDVKIDGVAPVHKHEHSHHHTHDGHHHHHHHHHHDNGTGQVDIHFGRDDAGLHVAGFSQSEIIEIEKNILSKNDQYAHGNRQLLEDRNILALNLVSSPGSGKTTLLTATINAMLTDSSIAVIEGDQETANDADRIRATGAKAIQINTGKGCHLDAHMIGHAMEDLAMPASSFLFIENVGNLVCPSSFDLGENHKVAILSVTEGEDKPLKYPDMFAVSDLMIFNKIDLLPYLEFDVDQCIEYAKRVNPKIEVIKLSATTGEGMDKWIGWLEHRRDSLVGDRPLVEGAGIVQHA